jgi:hypothetical protein
VWRVMVSVSFRMSFNPRGRMEWPVRISAAMASARR